MTYLPERMAIRKQWIARRDEATKRTMFNPSRDKNWPSSEGMPPNEYMKKNMSHVLHIVQDARPVRSTKK